MNDEIDLDAIRTACERLEPLGPSWSLQTFALISEIARLREERDLLVATVRAMRRARDLPVFLNEAGEVFR